MAKRPIRKTPPPTVREPDLTVPAAELAETLDRRIGLGEELASRQITSEEDLDQARQDYYSWSEYNETLLRRSFTTSKPADEYASSAGVFVLSGGPDPLPARIADHRDDISKKLRRLRSLKEQLPLYGAAAELEPAPARRRTATDGGTRIFVVHGHNEAVKQEVARFVSIVTGQQPTILHEEPNQGRTIIEKFEDVADDVGFAIVLLTGDDEGGVRGSGDRRSRARQNVVLELGFFIGAIGRSRVAVVHEDGVELPSDISGVLYTAFDSGGGWRLELAREIKAAGIAIDAEKLL